jgi:hypothetical protein
MLSIDYFQDLNCYDVFKENKFITHVIDQGISPANINIILNKVMELYELTPDDTITYTVYKNENWLDFSIPISIGHFLSNELKEAI